MSINIKETLDKVERQKCEAAENADLATISLLLYGHLPKGDVGTADWRKQIIDKVIQTRDGPLLGCIMKDEDHKARKEVVGKPSSREEAYDRAFYLAGSLLTELGGVVGMTACRKVFHDGYDEVFAGAETAKDPLAFMLDVVSRLQARKERYDAEKPSAEGMTVKELTVEIDEDGNTTITGDTTDVPEPVLARIREAAAARRDEVAAKRAARKAG